MNRLIVGCGYLGIEIALQWLASGDTVYGVTRSPQRAKALSDIGIQPVVWNWYEPIDCSYSDRLKSIDSVAVCVSHAECPDVPADQTHVKGLRNLVSYWSSQDIALPQSWCYVSTTGVYAPRYDGGWVDEDANVLAQRAGSIAAVSAEYWVRSNIFEKIENRNMQGAILRAAGIYGPGRIPRLDVLKQNELLEIDPNSYLNLIHVTDLAGIVIDICERRLVEKILNVADGNPVVRRDYYDFIASQIGSKPPRFAAPDHSNGSAEKVSSTSIYSTETKTDPVKPRPRSRGEGSKRVSIERLRQATNYSFRYPDYRAGLAPLLTAVPE